MKGARRARSVSSVMKKDRRVEETLLPSGVRYAWRRKLLVEEKYGVNHLENYITNPTYL